MSADPIASLRCPAWAVGSDEDEGADYFSQGPSEFEKMLALERIIYASSPDSLSSIASLRGSLTPAKHLQALRNLRDEIGKNQVVKVEGQSSAAPLTVKAPTAAALDAGKRPIDIRCLKDIPATIVLWLWVGVLARGMVSLLAGKGGLGKTYVWCWVVASLSVGRKMPDGTTNPPMRGAVLSREDDAGNTIRPRASAAGADLSMIDFMTLADADSGTPLDLAEYIPRLIDEAKNRKWQYVIVDTFAAYAPAGTDSNSAGDVRVLLNGLQRLAAATGAAVWLVAHTRKPGNTSHQGDAVDAVAGSVQMVAGVRMVSLLEPSEHNPDERWLRVVKSNLCPPKHSTGWTWKLVPGLDDGITPTPEWKVADQEVAEAATMAKAGRSCIAPETLRSALLEVVARGPLHVDDATDAAWRKLRGKAVGNPPKKADVHAAMVILLQDLGDGLEVRPGPRGVRLLGIPGTFPPTPAELATPGMSVRKLMGLAKCGREAAQDALDALPVATASDPP